MSRLGEVLVHFHQVGDALGFAFDGAPEARNLHLLDCTHAGHTLQIHQNSKYAILRDLIFCSFANGIHIWYNKSIVGLCPRSERSINMLLSMIQMMVCPVNTEESSAWQFYPQRG